MFQPLYSTRGKVSVPPLYTFLAILIQFFKGYSDKEMGEASRFDDRIKWAITAPRDFKGIDSFMVWGAYAKQDTYTMIYQGIKIVLSFMGFYGKDKKVKVELSGKDYDSEDKKHKINWENKTEKEKFLDRLVEFYWMLSSYFNDSCFVAVDNDNVLGFISGISSIW